MSESEVEILRSGQYYIRCEEAFAGRSLHEDMSLRPKGVICPTDNDNKLWNIQRLGNGRYKLSALGAPVGAIDNLLFAFLIEQERADEWIIIKRKPIGHPGRALFTIARADGLGWIKSSNVDEPQIAVRHLIVLPSEPPQFIPSELWSIEPLVD